MPDRCGPFILGLEPCVGITHEPSAPKLDHGGLSLDPAPVWRGRRVLEHCVIGQKRGQPLSAVPIEHLIEAVDGGGRRLVLIRTWPSREVHCRSLLKIHAAEKVYEARVQVQSIISTSRIRPWPAEVWECWDRRSSIRRRNPDRRRGLWLHFLGLRMRDPTQGVPSCQAGNSR
jgi:hypothetical protein